MKRVANNFDLIAPWYDFLARMVFGESIVHAQLQFLDRIPDGSKVLVLGGGTGWLLKNLVDAKPACEVWYIEASSRMLMLAKRKTLPEAKVHFIHGTESDIPHGIIYQAVVTAFYLDLFSPAELLSVVRRIRQVLDQKGIWLATDFKQSTARWQSVLLKIMYLFFRITAGVRIHHLPPWKATLESVGMRSCDEKTFYNGFICSTYYETQETG